MKEALLVLSSDLSIIYMNLAAKSLFKVKKNCIGDNFLTLNRNPEFKKAFEKTIAFGQSDLRLKLDGKTYQFDLSLIKTPQAISGITVSAYDISAQINAEANRREFTANVSHELKTPLQSIIGSAELIENKLVKEKDLPRFIGHIRNEASKLVSLIENILRLAQLDEAIKLPYETIDLNALSKTVFDTLSASANEKNITLLLQGEFIQISGVKPLLFEILYNLCDNEIKYSPPNTKVLV